MHIIYFDPDWKIFILASDAATDNAFLMHLNYRTEETRRIVKKVDFILTNQKKICVQKKSARCTAIWRVSAKPQKNKGSC